MGNWEGMNRWEDMAACRGGPYVIFFSDNPWHQRQAKACCASCTVRQPCREAARRAQEVGTWGGETEVERRAVKRLPVSSEAH